MVTMGVNFKRVSGPTFDGEDFPSAIKGRSTLDTTEATIRTTAAVGPAISADPLPTDDDSEGSIMTTHRSTLTRTAKTTVTHPTETTTDEPTDTATDDVIRSSTTTTKEPSSMVTGDITLTVTNSAISEGSTLDVAPVSETSMVAGPTDSSQTITAVSSETSSVTTGANEGEAAPLPTTTIVGIAVGSGAAGLAAIFLLFFFVLRHRRSKRASSVRAASSPKYDDDKFVGTGTSLSQPTALSKPISELNEGDDVFAPFGG